MNPTKSGAPTSRAAAAGLYLMGDGSSICRACNHFDLHLYKHIPPFHDRLYKANNVEEHMQRKCTRCGYIWKEKCQFQIDAERDARHASVEQGTPSGAPVHPTDPDGGGVSRR